MNNGVMQPVSRERIDKHIPAVTNMEATIEEPVSKQRIGKHTTIGLLLETFSLQSAQSGYNEDRLSPQESEFEAEWEFCITEKWVL
jgi:hypothetical protein